MTRPHAFSWEIMLNHNTSVKASKDHSNLGEFNRFHGMEPCGFFFTTLSCEGYEYSRCIKFSLTLLIVMGTFPSGFIAVSHKAM